MLILSKLKRAFQRPRIMREWHQQESMVAVALLGYIAKALSFRNQTAKEIRQQMEFEPESQALDRALKNRTAFYKKYEEDYPEIKGVNNG